jgi:hypothetical protein
LAQLRQYGISGDLILWLENYLMKRNQKGFVGTSFSNLRDLHGGVPQGSVFGLFCF